MTFRLTYLRMQQLADPLRELQRLKANPQVRFPLEQLLPPISSSNTTHMFHQIAFGRALEMRQIFARTHTVDLLGTSGNETLALDLFTQTIRPKMFKCLKPFDPHYLTMVSKTQHGFNFSDDDYEAALRFFGHNAHEVEKGRVKQWLLNVVKFKDPQSLKCKRFFENFDELDHYACSQQTKGTFTVICHPKNFHMDESCDAIFPALSDPAYQTLLRKTHALARHYMYLQREAA